ncbi:hypothetical protein HK097_009451 [Rhizophlyctis rosea]|uniref:PhoD-like phosphatase domain-containing protein n=1 Tax=Rhizophlyctis rosea TaxID=64517 RepID=A0AAD5X4J9_9FUNG|nr:hypothetical protein HK097_009451 [Rhizophlyctis rosea]
MSFFGGGNQDRGIDDFIPGFSSTLNNIKSRFFGGGDEQPAPQQQHQQQADGDEDFDSLPNVDHLGPFLRFHDINLQRGTWHGSVLIVVKGRPNRLPVLRYDDNGRQKVARATELDTYEDNVFYRFDLEVALGDPNSGDKAVVYRINCHRAYTFYVPPAGTNSRVFAMSCNGFSSDVENPEEAGGFRPLWDDMMRRHRQRPYHVMLGGGDQLYMDPIFTTNEEIIAWLKMDDRETRVTAPFAESTRTSVTKFCFTTYANHFSNESLHEPFATIPYVFQWDDHDIFDGWGSYPPYLQDCQVFQGIYSVARRFYLLFQQHTTDRNRNRDEPHVWGANGSFSYLKHLGPQIAVLGVDTRSERTLKRIMSPENWDQTFDVINQRLAPSVKHLVVMLAVPIVWPRLELADQAMETIADFSKFAEEKLKVFSNVFGNLPNSGIGEAIGKTGLYKNVMGCFGEPELADDLCDHWTHDNHAEERRRLVHGFQQLAEERRVRVTFLSGDVHCCGAGWFRSKEIQDSRRDPRVMWQIVSSAIINVPPPGMVISMLHRNAHEYDLGDGVTIDEMIEAFKSGDVNGESLDDNTKVLPRRNYSTLEVVRDDTEYGAFALNAFIVAESVERVTDAKPYPIRIEPLL